MALVMAKEDSESEGLKESLSGDESNTNAISTTLYLQNHEKISLISSLGPSSDIVKETRDDCSVISVDRQPQCRICLLCTQSKSKPLISPCRCAGTMQFVHSTCLLRWIDVSARKAQPCPRCELCGYRYKRQGLIHLNPVQYRVPSVCLRDKILNFLTLLLLSIMAFCGWVIVRYIKLAIKRWKAHRIGRFLNDDDITMVSACVLFLIALFLAVFTQNRAETPIYSLVSRCWSRNRAFREYQLENDPERTGQMTEKT
uniref:RING-CH-type domain-containing protein n=2 Tax=Bursaphelenchus xylophilus TaxID=6326 RepID=A0A1I7RL18_BURXY